MDGSLVTVIFGDHVRAPASSAVGERAVAGCRGAWWTVDWFVPEGYARCVRVEPPNPELDDWWDAYRSLFGIIATVGAAHTSTPARAWFGVWEGHGWETSATLVATSEVLDRAGRWSRRAARARARADDARRQESIRSGLREVPRFELPNRTYFLLEGSVAAATEVREPGFGDRWQRPDLFWPDDRSWHVATDVDFWALYMGGSADFVADLVDAVPTAVEDVALDCSLVAED